MKILMTDASVDQIGCKWAVVYEGYVLGLYSHKEDALGVALDKQRMESLIPKRKYFSYVRQSDDELVYIE